MQLHQAQFQHQLLSGSLLGCLADRTAFHGGDEVTVNVGHMDLSDPALPQYAGPSYRHISDLADWSRCVFVHPMGQDGSLFSSGYDQLLQPWATGGYLFMDFTSASSASWPYDQNLLPAS